MAGGAPNRAITRGQRPRVRLEIKRPIGRGLVRLRRVKRLVAQQIVTENVDRVRGHINRTHALTVEGLTPEAALHARRNFRLGVLNGIMFSLVDALIAPSFALALFVNRLGAPNVLVGLIPAIMTGGAFLPQIFVAGRVQGRRYVIHWYRRTAAVRTLCIALLAVLTPVLADKPSWLLVAFFVLYSGYALGGGISTLPWFEIVGKIISPRRRGTFFSLRSFWGGVLALLSSGIISAILSERFSGLSFPYNFALLFAITSLIIALGFSAMGSVKEPAALQTAPPISLSAAFRRGIEATRVDNNYRAFMVARVLLAFVSIADPFYVVYARVALGAPLATVGLYLAASSISALLSNFLWGPLSDRASSRTLMVLTVLSVATVPLAALVIPLFQPYLPADAFDTLFALVFVFGGLATGSARIVNNNMILTIAPPAERATYVGFLNTVLGLVTFIAVVGGVLVDAFGFTVLFVVSVCLAAIALVSSARMSQKPAY